jgi:hypothetical protein
MGLVVVARLELSWSNCQHNSGVRCTQDCDKVGAGKTVMIVFAQSRKERAELKSDEFDRFEFRQMS